MAVESQVLAYSQKRLATLELAADRAARRTWNRVDANNIQRRGSR